MVLRLIQIGNALSTSYTVDSTSVFQPGNIGQLKVVGNQVVAGLSDGTAPFGIIDDVRTAAFTTPSIDVVTVIPAVGVQDAYGRYYTVAEAKQELPDSQIVPSSFVCDVENLELNHINGILTAPAGTELNFDLDGDHIPDSIKVISSYVSRVPDLPGDDTTLGSNRVTLWFCRGIFETDQFDPTQRYPINATLYVNENGQLTSKQITPQHPPVGIVTGPPSAMINTLQFLWG